MRLGDLTKTERAEAMRLCKAATPGPWRIGLGVPPFGRESDEYITDPCGVALWDESGTMHEYADALFIAASRALIPRYEAALARAEACRDRYRDAITAARTILKSQRDLDGQSAHGDLPGCCALCDALRVL